MAPSYTPDYSALDSLKRQKVSKVATVTVEPKDPNERVNNITLRGSTLASHSGNFAKYLEDAIKSDLTDANLLDSSSLFKLSAILLTNDINVAGFGTGYGTIEAKFSIYRNETSVFDKKINVETEFESSFAGAVAIPKGQNEYPNLVRALLKKLYLDKEFINALQN
jgi:hypothetical protein